MMAECTDPVFEQKLHSFELGMLSDEDRKQFEEHLLACPSCFEQFQEFLPSARLLRHHPEFKRDAVAHSPEKLAKSSKWTNVTKFLAAAVIVLAIAIPSFIMFGSREGGPPGQKIVLLPVRTLEEQVVNLSIEGTVEISFAADELTAIEAADIRLLSRNSDTLLAVFDYSDITPNGMGSVIVNTDIFSPGRHQLEVSEHGAPAPLRIYYFMVK